jgi:hypothetical protein
MVLGPINSSSIIIIILLLGGAYFAYLLFTQPELAFQVILGIGKALFAIIKGIFIVMTAIVKFIASLFSKKRR